MRQNNWEDISRKIEREVEDLPESPRRGLVARAGRYYIPLERFARFSAAIDEPLERTMEPKIYQEKLADRFELVKRWAELEPTEYRASAIIAVGPTHEIFTHSPTHQACLLHEVIAAIKARGWAFEISNYRMVMKGTVSARVVTGPNTILGHNVATEGICEEPCDAILEAYILALEATR